MFSTTTTMTVLLFQVEGDEDILNGDALVTPRLHIKRTSSISETIDMMLEYNVIALFMDVDGVGLNVKTSMHAIELIRTSERHKQIPVIFLFNTPPDPLLEFHKPGDGPVDCMIKPLNRSILANKINAYHDNHIFRTTNSKAASIQNVYRRFFENGPSPFILIDRHGYILDINSSFLIQIAKNGRDKLDYIGQHIFSLNDLFHSKILDMFKSILAGKRPPKSDIVLSKSPQDAERYFSICGSPITNGNDIEFVIFIYEDISERIETENDLSHSRNELVRANSELQRMTEDLEKAISKANKMAVEAEIATITKSGFLASMSHEIRTPLNAVVGFTDLMLSTRLTEEQREYIESIRDSSQTFLGLINDILDFSKIEADRVELEKIPFILEAIMDEVINTTGLRAYEKNIEIAYQIQPGVPEYLNGDPVRLKQILVNIIGNAVKFTARGHIFIRVFLISGSSSSVVLRFTVSDTGIGIPLNKIDRIFQPFSQASNSTTREFGGTGLGLAISKKLAELMNGSITVESPNPESLTDPGTIFHIETTFGLIDDHPGSLNDYNEVLKGKRVAIMCGDSTLLQFYIKMLEDAGMKVLPVYTPSDIYQAIGSSNRERSLLLIDDTATDADMKRVIDFMSDGSLEKCDTAMMLSPYSDIEKKLLDIYPHVFSFVSLFKKPFKMSHVNRLLSRTCIETAKNKINEDDGVDQFDKTLNLNILLVEDNKINQKVAIKMLKKMGHTVTVADNGNEAIDILRKKKGFDLVFMDGQMPVMDGFKATEIIRRNEQADPDAERLPIIALTANAMKGDRDRYLKAGMDDYIAKPVKYDDLSAAITNIMMRKKSGDFKGKNTLIHPEIPEF